MDTGAMEIVQSFFLTLSEYFDYVRSSIQSVQLDVLERSNFLWICLKKSFFHLSIYLGQLDLTFIHSLIQAISIAPFQVHYYSEVLTTHARILCQNFTLKRHRHLWVKDLPKVPMWRLERESNPWPFGRKASTLPMRHPCPTFCEKFPRMLQRTALMYTSTSLPLC